ncbi:class I SAM-dependent methyltransferase [Allosalinactinospora lopnorensis]|uniref:class I SAM-dependent methyltransferase n=1 Tax=Allosalinactinospora lopnorensis TaxID=1352348 RepID=UPI000698AA71|nr:class I SAM-dependent methyltransferase [Allosalinactinospora lopnorensis]
MADLGCGPGRVTAYLDSLGVAVFGLDLSPAMVALARRAYPGPRFDEGSMGALKMADGALGGAVAWYSIIHTPPERLPAVFGEFSGCWHQAAMCCSPSRSVGSPCAWRRRSATR